MSGSNYPNKLRYEKCVTDIGILLQKASVIFQLMERDHVKQSGFTGSQSFLMILLIEGGELSVNDIAAAMELEKSSVSRMVKILVRDGYLERQTSGEDRRCARIFLSEKGRRIAEKLRTGRREYYSRIISNLPEGHVREVMSSAEILVKALEAAR